MPKSLNSSTVSRRNALLLAATATVGAASGQSAFASDSVKTGVHQESGDCSTPRSAVAKAQYGKVRGFGGAAYEDYFTWQMPILDGVPGAWHTAELQFCFDNTKRCEQGTGNTPQAQALARKIASSWAVFATTGEPSIPGLRWEPSDPETNQNMLWDNDCRMVNDPEAEARKIILS